MSKKNRKKKAPKAPRVVFTMNTGTRTMKPKQSPKGGNRNKQQDYLDGNY